MRQNQAILIQLQIIIQQQVEIKCARSIEILAHPPMLLLDPEQGLQQVRGGRAVSMWATALMKSG